MARDRPFDCFASITIPPTAMEYRKASKGASEPVSEEAVRFTILICVEWFVA